MHGKIVFCETYLVLECHMRMHVLQNLNWNIRTFFSHRECELCSHRYMLKMCFFFLFHSVGFFALYPHRVSLLPISIWCAISLLLAQQTTSCCLTGFCSCHYYCRRYFRLVFPFSVLWRLDLSQCGKEPRKKNTHEESERLKKLLSVWIYSMPMLWSIGLTQRTLH